MNHHHGNDKMRCATKGMLLHDLCVVYIYDMGPTALLPLRRKACLGFFRPKNPTASAGFEAANLGTKGQHAIPRPPKQMLPE